MTGCSPGVAGSLAEMWDVDPSLVRIAWALLAILTGGVAILVYIVMAIVIPEEEDRRPGVVALADATTATAGTRSHAT